MKQFTILKVGYTKSIYGCSNEYFNCIVVNKKGIQSITFKGLYGPEERLASILKDRGYKEKYISTDYGQLTTRGDSKVMDNMFVSESQAIEQAKRI